MLIFIVNIVILFLIISYVICFNEYRCIIIIEFVIMFFWILSIIVVGINVSNNMLIVSGV